MKLPGHHDAAAPLAVIITCSTTDGITTTHEHPFRQNDTWDDLHPPAASRSGILSTLQYTSQPAPPPMHHCTTDYQNMHVLLARGFRCSGSVVSVPAQLRNPAGRCLTPHGGRFALTRLPVWPH